MTCWTCRGGRVDQSCKVSGLSVEPFGRYDSFKMNSTFSAAALEDVVDMAEATAKLR